ncbi:hypothetical protein C1645_737954 [Glomus cerebriforme]|uniref:Uncharacterized protein n=1 Tax=Glomus cerebriforme TaxID=658196 RepID=A0A397SXC3_9GLOM|nr:hypothetical protein C1645_737954 [Glomus cerebriforme]
MNSDKDSDIDHDLKWAKNNGDFSEMIENMFEWNVMGTLSDGDRVFYINENVNEEIIEEEVRNEYHVNIFENLSSEDIIVEEEEIIEMSGVSLYEGCYDIEMKFIEEDFVNNYDVSKVTAYPFSENGQNRRENISEKFIKDCKKEKLQLDNRIHDLKDMQDAHENMVF